METKELIKRLYISMNQLIAYIVIEQNINIDINKAQTYLDNTFAKRIVKIANKIKTEQTEIDNYIIGTNLQNALMEYANEIINFSKTDSKNHLFVSLFWKIKILTKKFFYKH